LEEQVQSALGSAIDAYCANFTKVALDMRWKRGAQAGKPKKPEKPKKASKKGPVFKEKPPKEPKVDKKIVDPAEMFKDEKKYAEWDEAGIPTKMVKKDKEVSDKEQDKFRKQQEAMATKKAAQDEKLAKFQEDMKAWEERKAAFDAEQGVETEPTAAAEEAPPADGPVLIDPGDVHRMVRPDKALQKLVDAARKAVDGPTKAEVLSSLEEMCGTGAVVDALKTYVDAAAKSKKPAKKKEKEAKKKPAPAKKGKFKEKPPKAPKIDKKLPENVNEMFKNEKKYAEYDDEGIPTKLVKGDKPVSDKEQAGMRKKREAAAKKIEDQKAAHEKYDADLKAWEQRKAEAEGGEPPAPGGDSGPEPAAVLSPQEFFSQGSNEGKYGGFDDGGKPTTDGKGKELKPKDLKKVEAQFAQQQEKYAEYQKALAAWKAGGAPATADDAEPGDQEQGPPPDPVPPPELSFKQPEHEALYSEWNDEGLPTHDAKKKKLSKKAQDEVTAQMAANRKKYESYLAAMETYHTPAVQAIPEKTRAQVAKKAADAAVPRCIECLLVREGERIAQSVNAGAEDPPELANVAGALTAEAKSPTQQEMDPVSAAFEDVSGSPDSIEVKKLGELFRALDIDVSEKDAKFLSKVITSKAFTREEYDAFMGFAVGNKQVLSDVLMDSRMEAFLSDSKWVDSYSETAWRGILDKFKDVGDVAAKPKGKAKASPKKAAEKKKKDDKVAKKASTEKAGKKDALPKKEAAEKKPKSKASESKPKSKK